MKYTINFRNRNNDLCRVEIRNSSATPIQNFSPATHPFVTNETSDEDIMLPIRTSTAKISFIASLSEIRSFLENTSDSQNWRVKLYVANDCKWSGFLSNQTYSQDYINTNCEFTVNAIDDLTALKSKYLLSPNDSATIATSTKTYTYDNSLSPVTMRKYLSECFSHIDYYDDHYFCFEEGASTFLIPTDDSQTRSLVDFSVSRRNFVEPYKDDQSLTKYDAISCYEFLEIFCTTFCFQLRQIGMSFHFCRNVNSRVYSDPLTLYAFDNGTPMVFSNTPAATTYVPSGTDHSQTLCQAPGKITVTANLNKIDDDEIPNIEDKGYSSYELVSDRSISGSKWQMRFMRNSNHHIQKIWKRNFYTNQWELYSGQPTWTLVFNSFLNNGTYSGGILLSEDYWYGPNADPGSTQRGDTKKNFNFHQRLYISSGVGSIDRTSSEPAFVLKNDIPMFFYGGGFNFQVTAHSGGSAPFMTGSSHSDRVIIQLSFRLGNKYWNGSSWVDTFSTFTQQFEAQQANNKASIDSNKTLQMDFVADDLVVPIPVDTTMYGTIELQIIHSYLDDHSGFPNMSIVYLEDMELTYCPPVNQLMEYKQDKPSKYDYISTLSNNGEDELDIGLCLHTNRDNQSSYGQLIYSGTPIVLINNQRLESYIKDLYVTERGQQRTYLSLSIKHEYHGDNESMLYITGGFYIPLAYTEIDWIDMTSIILFVKALPLT